MMNVSPTSPLESQTQPLTARRSRRATNSNYKTPENAVVSPASCRYDSSLGLLTKKFIDLLNAAPEGRLDLNKAVEVLNVQKRRIYDITNVLEGIGIIVKSCKNTVTFSTAVGSQYVPPPEIPIVQLFDDGTAATTTSFPAQQQQEQQQQPCVTPREGRMDVAAAPPPPPPLLLLLEQQQQQHLEEEEEEDEISVLRRQIEHLRQVEQELDSCSSSLWDGIAGIVQHKVNTLRLYITDADVAMLPVIRPGDQVVAILAPRGTSLECPEAQVTPGGDQQHSVIVRSKKEPVEIWKIHGEYSTELGCEDEDMNGGGGGGGGGLDGAPLSPMVLRHQQQQQQHQQHHVIDNTGGHGGGVNINMHGNEDATHHHHHQVNSGVHSNPMFNFISGMHGSPEASMLFTAPASGLSPGVFFPAVPLPRHPLAEPQHHHHHQQQQQQAHQMHEGGDALDALERKEMQAVAAAKAAAVEAAAVAVAVKSSGGGGYDMQRVAAEEEEHDARMMNILHHTNNNNASSSPEKNRSPRLSPIVTVHPPISPGAILKLHDAAAIDPDAWFQDTPPGSGGGGMGFS